MSLQERLGGQNTLQLISLSAGLSLMTSGNPTFGYNFPLMLFGIVAHEVQSSAQPLTIFLSFTAFSALFDILGLLSGSIFSITGLVSLSVLLLKAPIFISGQNTLRDRGGEIRWPTPAGLQQGMSGFGSGGFGGAGRGQTLGSDAEAGVHPGQTVWSMPGGFSDTPQGGQASQGQQPRGPAASQSKGTFPSSGGFRLGGDDEDDSSQSAPPPPPAPGRNGYSSIA